MTAFFETPVRESLIAAIPVGALGQFGDVDPSAVTTPTADGSQLSSPAATGPIDLPTGVFRDKGLADVIRMYLGIAKRKQTQKEIKTALMEGGLATTATFFDATLAGTLHRMKRGGELLQFKDGWDLAASYPENFRQRMAQAAEPPKRRQPKRVARAKKSEGKAAKPKTAAKTVKAKPAAAPADNADDAPLLKAV